MSARQDKKPERRGPRCPICRDEVLAEFRPFCSKRCSDVDLGRWLNGSYAIPGHVDDDEDGMSGSEALGAGSAGSGSESEF